MKIDKSIQYITHKQIKKIKEWESNNPHYLKDEKLLLEWHMMVQAIMGGSEDHEKEKNNEKKKNYPALNNPYSCNGTCDFSINSEII